MKRRRLSSILPFLALSVLATGAPARAVEVEFERDPSLPLVYLSVAVKTGTASDPAGQSGISNFVASMLRRGTQSRSKEQIDLALDQIGGRVEVETRAEALILRGAVLAAQLDSFLELLHDLVTRPSFPEHEIRKLKGETVGEILQELNNDTRLGRRAFERFLFSGHPYGKPILGSVRSIEALTREQVTAHYGRLFRDDLLLVVGSGDAQPSRIREFAKALAAARPAGGEKLAETPAPAAPAKRRVLIVDKPERTQTQINAGQLGVRLTDEDFFPLYVGNHAFGGSTFSSRLMTEIRVQRGWSYGAYSFFRHGREPRTWQMYTFPAVSYTPDALKHLLAMADRLKREGLTAEELEFAQAGLVNGAGFMYNTPKKRIENALLERTLELPQGFMRTYADRIGKLTLDQVNSAARRFLDPSRFAVVVVGTATPEFRKRLAEAAGVPADEIQVEAYTAE